MKNDPTTTKGGRPLTISPKRERRQRITVVLDQQSYRKFKMLAKRRGISMSEILRLEAYRQIGKTPAQELREDNARGRINEKRKKPPVRIKELVEHGLVANKERLTFCKVSGRFKGKPVYRNRTPIKATVHQTGLVHKGQSKSPSGWAMELAPKHLNSKKGTRLNGAYYWRTKTGESLAELRDKLYGITT